MNKACALLLNGVTLSAGQVRSMGEIMNYPYFTKGLIVLFKVVHFKCELVKE